MRIFNYSKFKRNDRKIYNIAGYSIPGGIDVVLLASALATTIFINLIVYPIANSLDIKYFDFANGSYMFGTLMIILPMILGGMISKVKINKIPIYKYAVEGIKYLLKPKNYSLKGEKCSNKDVSLSFSIDDPI